MHKIPTASEQQQKELQQQAFIANTRFNLSSTFLNTILGRLDLDLTVDGQAEEIVKIALDYADGLMIKLGMIVKTPVE